MVSSADSRSTKQSDTNTDADHCADGEIKKMRRSSNGKETLILRMNADMHTKRGTRSAKCDDDYTQFNSLIGDGGLSL